MVPLIVHSETPRVPLAMSNFPIHLKAAIIDVDWLYAERAAVDTRTPITVHNAKAPSQTPTVTQETRGAPHEALRSDLARSRRFVRFQVRPLRSR